MSIHPTLCAQLTPPGRGAVAVIGLHGPLAARAIGQHFRPANGAPYPHKQARKIVYGIWQPTGEDLIVVRRGKDHLEVHCHGGNAACYAILNSLTDSSVTRVSASELAAAFEDSWSMSTRIALTRSTTNRTAKILLDSLEVLPAAIKRLNELIESNQRTKALAAIGSMLRWAEFGFHLTQPRSIVLFGQPNVGKSSLVNAIVGFQRAIVHDVAGTTRDVVAQQTAIAGWPVELKDTAGLREPTTQIESIGIEHAKTEISSANLRICVFDLSRKWTDRDQLLIHAVKPQMVVFNKSDLGQDFCGPAERSDGLKTSVATGEGIKPLIDAIGNRLVPISPASDQAFPVTPAQRRKLHEIAFQMMSPSPGPAADIYNLEIPAG